MLNDRIYVQVYVFLSLQPVQREAEIQAEDDQVFLMKLQTLLTKQPTVTGRQV